MTSTATRGAGAPALDSRRSWLALMALVPASLAIGLDGTIAAIALPTLATEFHASSSTLQWFIIAFTLAFAATLIPTGILGDRLGRKKVLLGALVVFGAASAACAYAPSSTWFIVARFALGIGGAAIVPGSMAMLPHLFSPAARPRALATLMAATMLGYPLGPLLGGWLLSHAWWGWAFLINVPMVLIALVAIGVLMPESKGDTPGALDLLGLGLASAGLVGLTYGATLAGDKGWGSPVAWAFIAAGLALGWAFVWWQQRCHAPLIDLTLFRDRGFATGTAVASTVSFLMFGLLFTVPQFAQGVMGKDAQGAGVRLLPLVAGMILAALAGERVAAKAGPRVVVVAGMIVLAVAMIVGSTTRATSGDGLLALWVGLAGVGLGLALPTAMDAAIAVLPEGAESTASAAIQAIRMVAGSIGAAVLGSVISARYVSHLPRDSDALAGLPSDAAEVARSGLQGALGVAQASGLPDLADAATRAFASGVDAMLLACAAVAIAGAAAALLLPGRASAHGAQSEA